MIPIINKSSIDDLLIHKHMAGDKIIKLLSFVKEKSNKTMTKTASSNQDAIINLFSQMLSYLNLKVPEGDVKNVLDNFAKSQKDFNKTSAISKSGDKKDEIKIVSKSLKDSHYQVDISKDTIVKNGNKVCMVSCYARDAYLGRYLIKRNYYFTPDREEFADKAYDEILLKMATLKDRYYNDIIDVGGIFLQMKTILDGVISEVKFEEDSLPSNVNR